MTDAERDRILTVIACCLQADADVQLFAEENLVPFEARIDGPHINVMLRSLSSSEEIRVRLALVDELTS